MAAAGDLADVSLLRLSSPVAYTFEYVLLRSSLLCDEL